MRDTDDVAPRAQIPADVDTPDKIVYGLTARQLAVLAVAGLIGYGIVQTAGPLLPAPALVAVLTALGAAAVVLALGRRDGLPMDAWLLAALRHTGSPQRLTATTGNRTVPGWAPATTTPAPAWAPLRLPAAAVTDAGVVDTGTHAVALAACTTVNIGLRTGEEQAALIGGYGRWLNSLTGPVQVVVSAQRVDLTSHAWRIAEHADTITNPSLADTARDYAAFLDDLAARRDPLQRTVTVAVTATTATEATRRAEHTADALAALGVQTTVLNGGQVTAVLTCAADPYTPADTTWARTLPDIAVTGPGL